MASARTKVVTQLSREHDWLATKLSSLSALSISQSLGHDPLLIALYDFDNTPDPGQVIRSIRRYASLSRTAAVAQDYPPAEYRKALRMFAEAMLAHRQINPLWLDVTAWTVVQGEPLRLIGCIAHKGELIRLMGSTAEQRLVFRHDRVREWILADSASELERRNAMPDDVISDPYFAEVIGAVFVWSQPKPGLSAACCRDQSSRVIPRVTSFRRHNPVLIQCCTSVD